MVKKVVVKIRELVKQRGMSFRELSRQTDIRHSTLSELANDKRQNINFHHIEKIADDLDINDIRKIIDFDKKESE